MRIIYFEGFMGALFFWLYRGLIKELKRKYPRAEVERRHWSNRDEIRDDRAIVIGHSFGAHAALMNTKQAKILITLDPRWWSTPKYRRKSGVLTHNFYQPNGLNGHSVEYAENHFYPNEGHLSIVRNPYIRAVIHKAVTR